MLFIAFKSVYLSPLKTCRLNSSYKSTARSLNNMYQTETMSQIKSSISIAEKTDSSHGYVALEVLGNTSSVSPCGLSLNTANRSYLFNCGEGMQKIMSEYKIRPSRFRDVFITYPSWKNVGGLIGATLSLQESNVKLFTIHGHSCLGRFFDVMKNAANFKAIKGRVRLCDHNSKFLDEFITVEFVHLYNSVNLHRSFTKSALDKFAIAGTSSIQDKNDLNNKTHLTCVSTSEYENKDSDFIKEKQIQLSDANFKNEKNYAISFIIHTKKSQGSLNFEKCVEFGVPVGPLLGKLKKGEDVKLENGNIVKSSDVTFPDLPGVIIIVVECPSKDYCEALLNEPAFFKHQSNNEEYYACAVVHFSNSKIIKSKEYQEWMSRFSKDTKHIFVNEDSEIGAFIGLHRHQFKLNMVHPEIFPPIQASGIPDFPRIENCALDEGYLVSDIPIYLHDKNSPSQIHSDKIYYKCKGDMHIPGETLCEIYLKPKRQFDYTKCLTLKKNEYLQEMLEIPDFMKKLSDLKKKIQNAEKTSHSDKKIYPKIVFLGTGSKKPSKTRNSSGILVFLSKDKSIILDCGESIHCQLLTFFGKEKTKEILRSLSAIFISHLHVDHHLGLITLLIERKHAFDELNEIQAGSDPTALNMTPFRPIKVIAPVQLLPLLDCLANEIYNISDLYTLIPCAHFLVSEPEINFKQIITELNLESLQTVHVKHAPNSFGVSLKHVDGWKLTYSGDTKPCQDLIKIGQDSDVLIHEATFDDIFEKEAAKKLHTTTSQAILIGRKMNAKFILLTHFSQRYCHLPMIKEEILGKHKVGIAFDFMQVSPYQFPILPHLYEPIKLVFTAYQAKLEHQNMVMKLKKELEKNSSEKAAKIPRMELS